MSSYHYEALLHNLTKEYGPRLGTFLANRIAFAIRKTKDLCIDNIRIARAASEEEMTAYNKRREQGCCGFFDAKVRFYSDEKEEPEIFWIGFNYGH